MSYYADKGNKYPQNPDLIIDFHGYTTFECQEAIDELIREGEHKQIRMIIGRGKRSANGPVLPDFIKNYLTSQNIRFNQSKFQDGGEGSLEVFFK
ncbi:MAG: Smr/MutS family protein [bacterium]|nr:Smr/MutS family protein [bacterium]